MIRITSAIAVVAALQSTVELGEMTAPEANPSAVRAGTCACATGRSRDLASATEFRPAPASADVRERKIDEYLLDRGFAKALAAVIGDLDESDSIDGTLILCVGESGRTPVINLGESVVERPERIADLFARLSALRGNDGARQPQSSSTRSTARIDPAGGAVAELLPS